MPATQVNGGMVGMGDISPHKNGGITLHHPPVPFGGSDVLFEESHVFLFREAVGILAADINLCPTDSVEEPTHVRFASTPAKRLVSEDQLFVGSNARSRKEKPLTLADKHIGFSAVTFLLFALFPAFQVADEFGLESFLGSQNRADWSLFRDTGHNRMAFVMPAKKFVRDVWKAKAVCRLPHHHKQVAIIGLDIENQNVRIGFSLDVKKLTVPVLANVNHIA